MTINRSIFRGKQPFVGLGMACRYQVCDDLITATFGVDFMTERANLTVGFDVLTFNRRIDLKDMMMKKTSQTSVESRRGFLKKVAYAAPAMVALGALSAPVNMEAKATSAILRARAAVKTEKADVLDAKADLFDLNGNTKRAQKLREKADALDAKAGNILAKI